MKVVVIIALLIVGVVGYSMLQGKKASLPAGAA